jgi:hypothetical protein
MESNRRFVLPLLFSVVGIPLTFYVVRWLSLGLAASWGPLDLIPLLPGQAQADANELLVLLLPLLLTEFLVVVVPLALLMLVFTKIARGRTYEIGIFSTGESFGTMKMLRRAIVPALFALSSGEIFVNLVPDAVFVAPAVDEVSARTVLPWFNPLQTILGALIGLVVALILFAPTWMLNDSGLVSQVKQEHMTGRRCPDTEGIGRWFSNLYGGFAVLAYPLTMFLRYFYQPYFVHNRELSITNVLNSIGWTLGIPFIVMSFVIPLIILNEYTITWTRPRLQRSARNLGARDVRQEALMLEMTEQVQEYLGPNPYDPAKGRTDTRPGEDEPSYQS